MFRVCFIGGEVGFPSTLAQYSTHGLGQEKCGGVIVVDRAPRWGSRLRKPTPKARGHTRLRQVWDSGFFVGECGGSVATVYRFEVGLEEGGFPGVARPPIVWGVCRVFRM